MAKLVEQLSIRFTVLFLLRFLPFVGALIARAVYANWRYRCIIVQKIAICKIERCFTPLIQITVLVRMKPGETETRHSKILILQFTVVWCGCCNCYDASDYH